MTGYLGVAVIAIHLRIICGDSEKSRWDEITGSEPKLCRDRDNLGLCYHVKTQGLSSNNDSSNL